MDVVRTGSASIEHHRSAAVPWEHGTNTVRTLTSSHFIAAVVGPLVVAVLGAGYVAAGVALVATIMLMIVLDVVHPPAVSTARSFAFRGEEQRTIVLFVVALAMIAVLVVLQRGVLWLFKRLHP
jgi:CBS-domain-containing membrane protein